MSGLLIQNADVEGSGMGSVRIRDEIIVEVGPKLRASGDESRIDAQGGALLPGRRDHHIHLMALSAARQSVLCGPPQVMDEVGLARRLRAAADEVHSGGDAAWLRGIGYHESVAGWLDAKALDRLVPDVPVRIQHRSGALWILNSAALRRLGISGEDLPEGVVLDAQGRSTGRLYRLDDWLREHLGASPWPDLAAVGAELARLGVTGLCDATASNGRHELTALERAVASGALPQRLLVMGGAELPSSSHPRVRRGHLKWMLDESRLPERDELTDSIASARAAGRGVAFHCVTRSELVLALGALELAGPDARDRIEHASVVPPELVELVAARGVRVVTQPNFLSERGDDYLRDVEEVDRPWLYRGRGFLDACIPQAGGTDAPFGRPDPWAAMRAAVERETPTPAAKRSVRINDT